MKPRLIIASNTAWNLLNFRAGLIRALIEAGFEVIAVAPPDAYVESVVALGCRFEPMPMDNKGTHPGRDLLLLLRFFKLLIRTAPSVVLSYTIKPNIYGSLAAHAVGVPVINNISGLGTVFIKNSLVTVIAKTLYRVALSRSARVFFQNDDDRKLFIQERLVASGKADCLPGSGINLSKFPLSPFPSPRFGGGTRFLLAARLLRDKGVQEYVEAARILKPKYPNTEFCLLGFLDAQNPTAIPRRMVEAWMAEGIVTYLGATDNILQELVEADCVVLPSYREGTPRTLLEAASIGRPIVTTDTIGCRDVVVDGHNGYLCKVRDAGDLASKLEQMINLPADERAQMGLRGREKMEQQFDETIVIRKYLHAISTLRASGALALKG